MERWDGVKDEKFQFYRGSLKNLIFKEGVCEKPICIGELPKSGAWTICRFKEGGGGGGGSAKKGGIFELRGVGNPMHTVSFQAFSIFCISIFLFTSLLFSFIHIGRAQ